MSTKVKKVVMGNGVFDVFHYGHLLHLEQAREWGDILWVAVTDDQNVMKGPGKPAYPAEQRRAILKALRCVDKVIIVSSLMEALRFVQPHILVKGIDYKEGLHAVHEKFCKEHGIEIRYTTTPKMSAAEIINGFRISK